jgi:hypothetical protein
MHAEEVMPERRLAHDRHAIGDPGGTRAHGGVHAFA